MKIGDSFKEVLSEGTGGHSYGCVMLYLEAPKKWWDDRLDKIDDDDVYNPEGERDYGKQPNNDSHVTILYGCESSVTDKQVEGVLASEGEPKLKIGGLSLFENKEFDVVKFDVSSDILNKLNKKMKEYPYTTSYEDYVPHITLCYVKKGRGKDVIKQIGDLGDIEFKPSHYIYSKANGEEVRFEIKED